MTDMTLLDQIREYFAIIQAKVILSNADSDTDINKFCENLLAKIFTVLFGTEIVNANYSEKKDFPGVDLIDKNNEYVFQITSTVSNEKIYKCLDTYKEESYYKRFKTLYIVYIGRQKEGISELIEKRIEKKVDGLFTFNYENNVIDWIGIQKLIKLKNETEIYKKINNVLSEQLGTNSENNGVLNDLKIKLDLLLNSQPVYTREINNDRFNGIHFDYRYLFTSFLGREKELEILDDFHASDSFFQWWIVVGRGGVGKNRLALEYCNNNDSEGGFISYSEVSRVNWSSWQPLEDTIIILDYVSVNFKIVISLIETLSLRSNIKHKIRLVLLERNLDGEWWDNFKISAIVKNTAYKNKLNPLILEGLTDEQLLTIVAQFNRDNQSFESLDKELLRNDLIKIDPLRRPLFAMFSGLSISQGESIRGWNQKDLLDFLLLRERNHIWKPYDTDNELPTHINLLAIITLLNGASNYQMMEILNKNINWLPSSQNFNAELYKVMTGYSADEGTVQYMPLLPDILGEYFVLESLKIDRKHVFKDEDKSKKIMEIVWELDYYNTWLFVRKALEDFPNHPSLPVLFNVINTRDNFMHSYPYIDLGITIYKLMQQKLKLLDSVAIHNLFGCLSLLSKNSKSYKHSLIDLDVSLVEGCTVLINYYIVNNNTSKQIEYYNIIRDMSDDLLKNEHFIIDQTKMVNDFFSEMPDDELMKLLESPERYRKENTEIFVGESEALAIMIKYFSESSLSDKNKHVIKFHNRMVLLHEKNPNEIRVLLNLVKGSAVYKISESEQSRNKLNYPEILSYTKKYYNKIYNITDEFIINCDKELVYVGANFQLIICLLIIREFEQSKVYYNLMLEIANNTRLKNVVNEFNECSIYLITCLREMCEYSLSDYYSKLLNEWKKHDRRV